VIIVTHEADVAAVARRNIRLQDGLMEAGQFGHESPALNTEVQVT
jgi:ABC-type lipoprotein export system ATPase subunit